VDTTLTPQMDRTSAGSTEPAWQADDATRTPRRSVVETGFILKDSEARELISLIYEYSGIVLTLDKKTLISSRLNKRLRRLGLRSFRQYLGFLIAVHGNTWTR